MRVSYLHDDLLRGQVCTCICDLTLRQSREREAYHERSLRQRYLTSTSCLGEVTAHEGIAKEAPTLWVYYEGRRCAAGSHPRLPSEAHAMGFYSKRTLILKESRSDEAIRGLFRKN